MSEAKLAASFLVVSQGIVLYSVFPPNMSDLRRNHPASSPALGTDLRVSEVICTVLVVATGIIASFLAKDALPFWLALLIAALMTGALELVFNLDPRKVIGNG